MTHTYQLTGMSCSSCEENVKSSLLSLIDVTNVAVSRQSQSATITMDKHVLLAALQNALGTKYHMAEECDNIGKSSTN